MTVKTHPETEALPTDEEPTQATKAAENEKPTEPAKPAKAPEPGGDAGPGGPAKTAKPAKAAELAGDAEPVEPVKVAATGGGVEPGEPAKTAKPAEAAELAEDAEPVEPAKATAPAENAALAELAEPAEPAEVAELAEDAEPVESVKVAAPGGDAEPGEPVKAVKPGKAAKRVENAGPAEDAEVGGSDGGEADGGVGGRTGRWWSSVSGGRVVSGVLVAALIVLAVVGCVQWRSLAGERAERAAVEKAAEGFGTHFLSYDHRDVEAAKNAVSSLITGDFAESYRTQFDSGVVPSIKQLEATSTARVRAVYVGDINGNLAAAVVVVDSEMHTKAWTKWTTGTHLDLKLIRQDGRWLVTDMTSVGATGEKMVDPSGKPIATDQQPPAATK